MIENKFMLGPGEFQAPYRKKLCLSEATHYHSLEDRHGQKK
jgi:hypothetical protein